MFGAAINSVWSVQLRQRPQVCPHTGITLKHELLSSNTALDVPLLLVSSSRLAVESSVYKLMVMPHV